MDIVHIFERLETQLGLFVPYFDSYIVIHLNLYAEATIASKKKQIKTIECYELIH